MYANIIFYKNGTAKIQPQVIELLKLACPEEFTKLIQNEIETDEDNTLSLAKFVEWTQQLWIKNVNNRWNINDPTYDKKKNEIQEILEELGFFNGSLLSVPRHDGAVMIGGSIANMAKRFFLLQEQINSGYYFKEIFLMGSLEDVSPYLKRLEEIYQCEPQRFKENIEFPKASSEHELMLFFIKNLRWPDHVQHATITPLPLELKTLNDGRLVKPNTQDQIVKVQKNLQENGKENERLRLAIFSNDPFTYRQHLDALVSCQNRPYFIETTSAPYTSSPELNKLDGATMDLAKSLDEVARLAYQLKEYVNKIPKAAEILRLEDHPQVKRSIQEIIYN
jgi:hypothetical protein